MTDHERQHTYQGQSLGPFYLPSNILGGVYGLLRGPDPGEEDTLSNRWHSHWNWNEVGPQSDPPQPWSPGRPR